MPLSKEETIEILETIKSCKTDGTVQHLDNCGLCSRLLIEAEEAEAELAKSDPDFNKFDERVKKRWKETKYCKFVAKLKKENPELTINDLEYEFQKKGWEL